MDATMIAEELPLENLTEEERAEYQQASDTLQRLRQKSLDAGGGLYPHQAHVARRIIAMARSLELNADGLEEMAQEAVAELLHNHLMHIQDDPRILEYVLTVLRGTE